MKLRGQPIPKYRRQIAWLFAILLVILGVTLWTLSSRNRIPQLDRDALLRAKAVWEHSAIRNYEIDLSVSGISLGHHHIVVKNSQVVFMSTDGSKVPQSAWAFWTVDGMFQFLSEELAQADRPKGGFGTKDNSEVYLSARFDTQWGFPIRYLRQINGQNRTIQWQVTKFLPTS